MKRSFLEMITDREIDSIFAWADKNSIIGKRWKNKRWGINLSNDEVDDVKRGIPRDRDTLLKITHLNLSKSKISDIPVELFKLDGLIDLDISLNRISTIPKEIKSLKRLEYLDISGNSYWIKGIGFTIFNMPREIRYLKNLKYLNISDLRFDRYPKEIWSLKTLKTLILGSKESLFNISRDVANLESLTNLQLSFLSNKKLPSDIGKLRSLKYLKIVESEELKSLPREIGELENLEYLELHNLGIEELPKEIGRLKKLNVLDVSSNRKLRELPKEIGELKELTYLNFSNSDVKIVPQEISNLKKLETLNDKPYSGIDEVIEDVDSVVLDMDIGIEIEKFPHLNLILKGVDGVGKLETLYSIVEGSLALKRSSKNILYVERGYRRETILNHIKKASSKKSQTFAIVVKDIERSELFKRGDIDFSRKNLPENLYILCIYKNRELKKSIDGELLRVFETVDIYPKYGSEFKSEDVSNLLYTLNSAILDEFEREVHPDRYLIGQRGWRDIEMGDRVGLYRELLRAVREFKEVKGVNFKEQGRKVFRRALTDSELSLEIKEYIRGCNFRYISYKEMISKLQAKIYNFI